MPPLPMPVVSAALKSTPAQPPIPVSRSGVIFEATTLPNGVSMGLPPAKGFPLPGTVWQAAQSAAIVRYSPF